MKMEDQEDSPVQLEHFLAPVLEFVIGLPRLSVKDFNLKDETKNSQKDEKGIEDFEMLVFSKEFHHTESIKSILVTANDLLQC